LEPAATHTATTTSGRCGRPAGILPSGPTHIGAMLSITPARSSRPSRWRRQDPRGAGLGPQLRLCLFAPRRTPHPRAVRRRRPGSDPEEDDDVGLAALDRMDCTHGAPGLLQESLRSRHGRDVSGKLDAASHRLHDCATRRGARDGRPQTVQQRLQRAGLEGCIQFRHRHGPRRGQVPDLRLRTSRRISLGLDPVDEATWGRRLASVRKFGRAAGI